MVRLIENNRLVEGLLCKSSKWKGDDDNNSLGSHIRKREGKLPSGKSSLLYVGETHYVSVYTDPSDYDYDPERPILVVCQCNEDRVYDDVYLQEFSIEEEDLAINIAEQFAKVIKNTEKSLGKSAYDEYEIVSSEIDDLSMELNSKYNLEFGMRR